MCCRRILDLAPAALDRHPPQGNLLAHCQLLSLDPFPRLVSHMIRDYREPIFRFKLEIGLEILPACFQSYRSFADRL